MECAKYLEVQNVLEVIKSYFEVKVQSSKARRVEFKFNIQNAETYMTQGT